MRAEVIDLSEYPLFTLSMARELLPRVWEILRRGNPIKFYGSLERLQLIRFVSGMEFDSIERSDARHEPVMVQEVLRTFEPLEGKVLIDATCGLGGHTKALSEGVGPRGLVLAIEKDPESLQRAKEKIDSANVLFYRGSFAEMKEAVKELGIGPVDGVLFDLGLSSFLLEGSGRGFSFRRDEPLDMRFDPSSGRPASYYINKLRVEELESVIRLLGEERFARRIARAIREERDAAPLERTADLNRAIERAVRRQHLLKAKMRVYQAFRILVNDELATLKEGLLQALQVLKQGGIIAVISYHSLEDRIVKTLSKLPGVEALYKKPLVPSDEEIVRNRRARSARLRAIKKVGDIDEALFDRIVGAVVPSPLPRPAE